jgi:hypothetical protein
VASKLNNYLKIMASQQAKKDNTRTFVLEDDNDNSHIIAFYTLTMTPIDTAIVDALHKRSKDSDYGARRKHAGIVDWIRIARTGFSILGRYVVLPFQISLRLGGLILGRTDID